MSSYPFWKSDELVIVMMGFLPLRRRLLLRRVCKLIGRICRQRPPTAFDLSYMQPHLLPHVLDYIVNEVGTRAQWVNLHGYNGKDINAVLQRLCTACPALQSLSVQFCWNLTDAGLVAIADHCPELRTLSIWDCHRITEPGFQYLLSKCRELRFLDLRGLRQLTDDTMEDIADLPEISHMSLTGSGCSARGFAHLLHTRKRGLRRIGCMFLQQRGPLMSSVIAGERIVELQLGYSEVGFFVDLKNLPNLKFLGLSQNRKNVFIDVNWLDLKYTKLEQLMADRCYFEAEFFQAMLECAHRMTYLCVLEPYRWEYSSLLPCLERFTSLKQLKVTNPSEGFLSALSQCPQLQFLWVENMQPTPERLAACCRFRKLRYFYLGIMRGLRPDALENVGRDLVQVLQNMPKLQSLYLHDVPFVNTDIEDLSQAVPGLHVLDLANTPEGCITVHCLEALQSFQKLKQLYVPASIYMEEEFSRALVAGLPMLEVYGPELMVQDQDMVSSTFAIWSFGCRRLPAKGYNERDAIKPPYSFVTTCDFEQDPVYNTTEI